MAVPTIVLCGVRMLASRGLAPTRAEDAPTQVALPYAADDLRMLLVLPEGEGLAGARKAALALPAAWATARPTREQKLEVVLPRFKIDSGANDLLPTLVERYPGLAAVCEQRGIGHRVWLRRLEDLWSELYSP